jgi:3-oxo-5-alpha-steroid 4-dehydrogenase 1
MFKFIYERHDGLDFWTPTVMIIIGVAVFIIEAFGGLRASYGRYGKSNIGLSAPIAWFLQEAPAFFIPLYLLAQNGFSALFVRNNEINTNVILLIYFLIHYFNR